MIINYIKYCVYRIYLQTYKDYIMRKHYIRGESNIDFEKIKQH